MSMNIFRLSGDMSHVFSIIVLLLRLRVAKNAQGISVRTHELFLVVFVTRYLDLFTTFYSLYNSCMKILYIVTTAAIIYMIRFSEPICSTYDKAQDTFLHWKFAVLPCAIIATITHMIGSGLSISPIELLWTFSIYLESVAILPQLIVLQRYREVENLTGNYIFFMGAYRALYILNWVYRAYYEPFYQHHFVVYFCGVLQTLLYADFFYYYVKSKAKGGKFSLPTAHES
uniref:ER lumen protein-retaining receptor n=1 Tax=Helicotheca tamesis TaxID=374047 RepID=A0A7S2MV43_9STRA|mmetsp:Transcript_3965/g.5349  ORF Transcript_3965/g.5349 Transcript_3965/m.5349 type:complete len:229 (+) Transcript_3965:144-830(+)